MNDFDQLGDTVKIEIDRRKLEKLVEDGVITAEELATAPVYHLVCPKNPDHRLNNEGTRCGTCHIAPIQKEVDR